MKSLMRVVLGTLRQVGGLFFDDGSLAILTGRGQFVLRRRLGRFGPAVARLTQAPAEALFRRLR